MLPNTIHVRMYHLDPQKHTHLKHREFTSVSVFAWKTRGKEYVLTLERLPTHRMHCYMGNPSKLPYICIKFDSPQVGNSMIPSIVPSLMNRSCKTPSTHLQPFEPGDIRWQLVVLHWALVWVWRMPVEFLLIQHIIGILLGHLSKLKPGSWNCQPSIES